MKRKNMNIGAALVYIITLVAFLFVFIRIVNLQRSGVYEGTSIKTFAEKQYSRSIKIDAHRGTIYDQNGIPLAQDVSAYNVIAILDKKYVDSKKRPLYVTDPKKTARKLAPVLDMNVSELEERLKTKKVFQVEFGVKGKSITVEKKEEIESLKLNGITFIRTSKRHYPNGEFASHTLGFSQLNDQEISEGKMGLEKELDKYLKEKDGVLSFKSDRFGVPLADLDQSKVHAKNGKDVYLTLDQKIQTFLEDSINYVEKNYKPTEIMAIVADPKTGAILGMASSPTFDPNKRNIENYMNTPIQYPFEPGSTMKIFTLASAIEEGVWNGKEKYKSGQLKVGPNTIRDHNGSGWGKITFLEGIQRSSNVAAAKLADKYVGYDKFHEYLLDFGFQKLTGVDLPNEQTGRILYDYPIEKATTSFGQGTSVTPIQQIQAATAIANEGKMMRPFIVREIKDSETGKIILQNKPKVVGNPVSKKTAQEVRDILETVVTSEVGTGKNYAIDGYSVAGKTGTAQIPGLDGKYLTGWSNYIFSFIGMVPKDNPKLLVYVAVKQPKLDDSKYEPGSIPVSHIFKTVVKNTLQYLNVRPINGKNVARSWESHERIVPKLVNLQVEDAKKVTKDKDLIPVVIGSGKTVLSQSPGYQEKCTDHQKIIILTNGTWEMPDLKGWSHRDVLRLCEITGLKVAVEGSGYVVEQSLPKGRKFRKDDTMMVQMLPPNKTLSSKKAEPIKDGTVPPLD